MSNDGFRFAPANHRAGFLFFSFLFLKCAGQWSPLRQFARPSEKGSCLEQGWGVRGSGASLRSVSEPAQARGSRGIPVGSGGAGEGDVHREQGTFRVREQTGDRRWEEKIHRLKGSSEQRSVARKLPARGHPKTTRSSLSPALPTTSLCFYFSCVGLFTGGWQRRAVETGRLQSRLEASVGKKDSLPLPHPLLQL